MDEEDTPEYAVIKFYRDRNKESELVLIKLTRGQAAEICKDPSTRGDGWFFGYEDGRPWPRLPWMKDKDFKQFKGLAEGLDIELRWSRWGSSG